MQISLLSRFQGTLVGAAVGDILGAYRQQEGGKQHTLSWLDSHHWQLGPLSPSSSPAWGSQWVDSLNDWIGTDGRNWSHLGQSCREIKLRNPAASAIALLPLIVISHDHPTRQRQALASTINQAGWDSAALVAALIVAAVINLALQNRLAPARVISHLSSQIKELGHPANNQQLKNNPLSDPEVLSDALTLLQVIQTLVRQPAELAATAELLQEISTPFRALGLALYCFLSTPEEYGLTVIRALRWGDQPQLAATLAGILAGVYNGLGGIPIAWRLGIQRPLAGSAAISILWRIPSECILSQLSEVLLANWAGADLGVAQAINFERPIHTFENSPFENSPFENSPFENSAFENSAFENSVFESSTFESSSL
ncbi:MAG: ADP-ribosylglycohydrolase family protein [Pseudanabaenales cyanobacterium]|nr:ADP-ribosylglycohydrolase family protein [Pseudanabaenales cyanobacterium]